MYQDLSPNVSVLVPVYNGERYLATAVRSIFAQTYTNFELLIADDGSSDASLRIAQEMATSSHKTRVLPLQHCGVVATRNALIENAKGNLLAWIDADDIAEPERLEKQVQYMDAHPDCIGLGTAVQIVDEDGDPIKVDVCPSVHAEIDAELIAGSGNGIYFPSFMVRREALDSTGGFRDAFPPAEDFDFFLRLAETGQLANVPDVLVRYRWHIRSVSWAVPFRQQERMWAAIIEARRRRSMPPVENPIINPQYRPSISETHTSWATQALSAGNFDTARKHARKALTRCPTSGRAWRLWAESAYPFIADPQRGRLNRLFANSVRKLCFGLSRCCGLFA